MTGCKNLLNTLVCIKKKMINDLRIRVGLLASKSEKVKNLYVRETKVSGPVKDRE